MIRYDMTYDVLYDIWYDMISYDMIYDMISSMHSQSKSKSGWRRIAFSQNGETEQVQGTGFDLFFRIC